MSDTLNLGVSQLRGLSANNLQDYNKSETILTVSYYGQPMSVLIPYAYYQKLCEFAKKANARLMTEGLV